MSPPWFCFSGHEHETVQSARTCDNVRPRACGAVLGWNGLTENTVGCDQPMPCPDHPRPVTLAQPTLEEAQAAHDALLAQIVEQGQRRYRNALDALREL